MRAGSASSSLLTNVFTIPEFAPLIGVMIGLGVGIDYALFIITRYRELTRAGATPEQATIGAMDTAGRAVVFAGITVVLSLLGMLLIGLHVRRRPRHRRRRDRVRHAARVDHAAARRCWR